MTLEEIRRKNAERIQLMQSKIGGMFVKYVNDQDTMVVRLVPPFDGFFRVVKTMQGDLKPKLHYRVHVIGDHNFYTKHPLSNPPLELTAEQIRNLKVEDAKIWTTPYNAVQGIQREIDRGHSILQIRRDGVAKSTTTTYNVLNAMQIADEDWKHLLPSITKEELKKIQDEETWEEISEEDLRKLETLGVKENG